MNRQTTGVTSGDQIGSSPPFDHPQSSVPPSRRRAFAVLVILLAALSAFMSGGSQRSYLDPSLDADTSASAFVGTYFFGFLALGFAVTGVLLWGRKTWVVSGQSGGSPIPSGQIGEGAIGFSHSGLTYLLGLGNDFYGIWDRRTLGPPIERFPRTPKGWDWAWNHFTAVETRFVGTGQVSGSSVTVRVKTPRGRPLLIIGLVAVIIIASFNGGWITGSSGSAACGVYTTHVCSVNSNGLAVYLKKNWRDASWYPSIAQIKGDDVDGYTLFMRIFLSPTSPQAHELCQAVGGLTEGVSVSLRKAGGGFMFMCAAAGNTDLAYTTTVLNFGEHRVGSSATMQVTVTNNGPDTMYWNSGGIVRSTSFSFGPTFLTDQDSCRFVEVEVREGLASGLGDGATCFIPIVFNPVKTGRDLALFSSGWGPSQEAFPSVTDTVSVALSGTGQ